MRLCAREARQSVAHFRMRVPPIAV
jgi:hypothetical protein